MAKMSNDIPVGSTSELPGVRGKTANEMLFESMRPTLRRLELARARQAKTLEDTDKQIAAIMDLIRA